MATVTTYPGEALPRGRTLTNLFARLQAVTARLAAARKARRDFEALRGASDHLLADIGITRSEIDTALRTPFWADPSVRISRNGR